MMKIALIRTYNQKLRDPDLRTPKEVIEWMGAMQSQDYAMAKWAVGTRMVDPVAKEVDDAIDSGVILRTHLLRPTWHIVYHENIRWMIMLSASRIRSSMKSRDIQLGLDGKVFRKCNRIFEKVLRDGNHLTRDELISELEKSGGISGRDQASHVFTRAETEGILCSGRQKKGKPTFALLDEWVRNPGRITTRDEALKELGQIYFRSRGPATVEDLAWWSGQSLSDSRKAVDMISGDLVSERAGEFTYWFSPSFTPTGPDNTIIFLPAFDELLLSYRNRDASLSGIDNRKAISDNGIFYPVLVRNGEAIGTWKRKSGSDELTVTARLFGKPSPNNKITADAFARYSRFTGKKIHLEL